MLDFNSLVKFYRRRPDLHFGHRFTWEFETTGIKDYLKWWRSSNLFAEYTWPEGDGFFARIGRPFRAAD